MNREQINTWRVAHGLAPIVASETEIAARKRRVKAAQANKAAHAQLQRDIRNARNRNKK